MCEFINEHAVGIAFWCGAMFGCCAGALLIGLCWMSGGQEDRYDLD